jgi:putative flippase GtrA
MTIRPLLRFLRFNAVGLGNLTLKLALLSALVKAARLDYLPATAISVEAALLHGFFWHHFWTWRDRRGGLTTGDMLARLLRFHLVTGLVALAANLLVMRVLVGTLGLHYLPSAVAATAAAGTAGFFLSNALVFLVPSRRA